jgi:hypothetical protein
MRTVRLFIVMLLAGCATVEHSTVVSQTRRPEECGKGDLVAAVFPGDWPNVVIEVQEQRTCTTGIDATYQVQRELRVSRDVAYWVGAGVGAAAGVGAMFALQKYMSRTPTTFNQGDGYLMLPLAGAAMGAALVGGLNATKQVQPLSGEVRVETSWERREVERPASIGLLSHRATPLAELRGGRAKLPLELAMSIYGRPLKLDGRLVDWSLRASAWVPGKLPACVRAADANEAFKRAGGWTTFSTRELARAEADAEACMKDGWPFAGTMLSRITVECRARVHGSCLYAQ